ncbi:MAG: PAS domain-containing protein, partial [Nitrospinaceae bacterium]|nr:PAS domain-containing protein [Nitrospinaceae bacterium]
MLDLFLDQIQEACFFIKDTDYRFVTGNAALVRILGASSLDEIIGKTDLDFTADFLASTFRDDDRAVLEDGKALFNKMELVPTTETLEWRCTTKVPLYDMQDRIIALAGM